MARKDVDVSAVGTTPMPAVPAQLRGLPLRNEQEGLATTYSPTGLPRIPTHLIPWMLLGAPVLTAGLMGASQAVEGSTARAVLMGASAAIATAAGIISQGYRKAPPQE